MEKDLKKFLEFNGRSIYFLAKDGQNWVALKPICEALNVDWINQFKNLKEDETLSRVLSKQTIHDASNRLQEMVCLPEKWIYGWLFSIRSESAELKLYKVKCYELLYDYFRGAMTERLQALRVKTDAEIRLERLLQQQKETDLANEIEEAKRVVKEQNKLLLSNDKKIIESQLTIFDNNEQPSNAPDSVENEN